MTGSTSGVGSHTQHYYDALGRRVKTGTAPDNLPQYYYADQWQVISEKTGTPYKIDNVWSLAYVDALVLRERDANNNTSDGREQHLYVQQDANWNVTAITDTSGAVQERFEYDPYGKHSFLTPNWGSRSSSSFAWVYLHQGGRWDNTQFGKLYHFRNRDYSPTLMRWMQQDPLRHVDGMNNYEYESTSPFASVDPNGTRMVTIRIYIDATTKPSTFNTQRVEKALNALLAQCTCKSGDTYRILLRDTERKPNPHEGLGWQHLLPPADYNQTGWDYVPFVNIGTNMYRHLFRDNPRVEWIGWVTFVNTNFPLGYTNGAETQLSPTGLTQAAHNAGAVSILWDLNWANFVAHEHLHLGVNSGVDHSTAGEIESKTPQVNVASSVSSNWCKAFLHKMGLSPA